VDFNHVGMQYVKLKTFNFGNKSRFWNYLWRGKKKIRGCLALLQYCEKRLLASPCLSVCQSGRN